MSVVIIDDQDSTVVRVGHWYSLGSEPEYLNTTSSSGTLGATLTVDFQGTGIAVYATLGSANVSTMSFEVDGGSSGTFTGPPLQPGQNATYHYQVYSSPSLSDGAHTLVVTPKVAAIDWVNVYIDYFLVTVGSSGGLVGRTIFYDDTDSAIKYSGSWSDGSGSDLDLKSSLHGAGAEGASATLAFIGTSVSVFGSVQGTTSGQIATFSVDNSTPLSFNGGQSPFLDGVAPNLQMFHSEGLSQGSHTLVMTASTGNAFFLDYVTVEGYTVPSNAGGSSPNSNGLSDSSASGTSRPSSPASPSESTGQSGFVAAPSGSVALTSTATSASTGSSGHSSKPSSRSTPDIVGGVVGAIACLLLGLSIPYIIRRTRRGRWAAHPPRAVEPYIPSTSNTNTSSPSPLAPAAARSLKTPEDKGGSVAVEAPEGVVYTHSTDQLLETIPRQASPLIRLLPLPPPGAIQSEQRDSELVTSSQQPREVLELAPEARQQEMIDRLWQEVQILRGERHGDIELLPRAESPPKYSPPPSILEFPGSSFS